MIELVAAARKETDLSDAIVPDDVAATKMRLGDGDGNDTVGFVLFQTEYRANQSCPMRNARNEGSKQWIVRFKIKRATQLERC